MKIALIASAVALAMTAPTLAAVNLVSNGDFSMPNTGGGYGLYDPAQSGGWANLTDTDGVEIGASGLYGVPCASAGCQNLEVNAATFGDVVQTITGLTPGAHYALTYDYGGRSGYGPQVLDVNFGGTAVATNSGSFGAFTPNRYVVTASGTSAVLEFKSEVTSGSGGGGNEITNVTLTAVPEPASWALLVVGFGLVGYAARRKAAVAA